MRRLVSVMLCMVLMFGLTSCSLGRRNRFAKKDLERFGLKDFPTFQGSDFSRTKKNLDRTLRFSCSSHELNCNLDSLYTYLLQTFDGELFYLVSEGAFAWFLHREVTQSTCLDDHLSDYCKEPEVNGSYVFFYRIRSEYSEDELVWRSVIFGYNRAEEDEADSIYKCAVTLPRGGLITTDIVDTTE